MVNAKRSDDADHLVEQVGREQRRYFAVVVGRRDFYQVASDKVLSFQTAHQVEDLRAGKSTDLGSARAGSKCWTDDVNIKSEIYRLSSEILQDLADRFGCRAVGCLPSDPMET